MERIKVVVIGYGYWGPNIVRNIDLNEDYELVGVVDQDSDRRDLASKLHSVNTYSSHLEITDINRIELAIICTRPQSHMSLANFFISNRINVLVTKPCGISSMEALEISKLASTFGVNAFCDFTYHFSPLLNFIQNNSVTSNIVNEMREYTSYRTSLGIVQADVDVLADLAVHDIYILLLLKGEIPAVASCLKTNPQDHVQIRSAFLTLEWPDQTVAGIHVSWNSPKKVRQILITGDNQGILLEEMSNETPIQILDYAPNVTDYANLSIEDRKLRNISYTMGNVSAPQITRYEALTLEIELIAQAIRGEIINELLPSASDAAKVWKVVETLRESSRLGGVPLYV